MKIECACGHLIHDGGDALPQKAHIIADQDWNILFDKIDDLIENRCTTATQRNAACMKLRSLVVAVTRLAWQCAACGRLYIDDTARALQQFEPASPETPREVFRRR